MHTHAQRILFCSTEGCHVPDFVAQMHQSKLELQGEKDIGISLLLLSFETVIEGRQT